MPGTQSAEACRRLEQWIQDGEYVCGRLIPELLRQHESLVAQAEAADRECERLRLEIGEARNELSGIRGENEQLRAERADIAGTLERQIGLITDCLYGVVKRLRGT
jgi:chromosome segregation ATPase